MLFSQENELLFSQENCACIGVFESIFLFTHTFSRESKPYNARALTVHFHTLQYHRRTGLSRLWVHARWADALRGTAKEIQFPRNDVDERNTVENGDANIMQMNAHMIPQLTEWHLDQLIEAPKDRDPLCMRQLAGEKSLTSLMTYVKIPVLYISEFTWSQYSPLVGLAYSFRVNMQK